MPALNDSDLYNIGLAFYNTRNDDVLGPTDVMDSETEETYYGACEKQKNFDELMDLAVEKCSDDYEAAINLNEADYQTSKEFFESKEAIEQSVISKIKEVFNEK